MVAVAFTEKREFIFRAVADMYTDVALNPTKAFHFPTGRLACLFVGYPAEQLDLLPPTAIESFAGVGYPFRTQLIGTDDLVLDVGCGSGTDTLLASTLVPRGKVFALDMTPAMLEKIRRNVSEMRAENVNIVEGNAERIPLPDASVDVVTSNGVLNLVPDKPQAFREIARVLRPHGRLQVSDICLQKPVSDKSRADPKLWAECVVGAVIEDDYLRMLREAGIEAEVVHRQDYFSGSVSADTRRAARGLGAHAMTLRGTRAP